MTAMQIVLLVVGILVAVFVWTALLMAIILGIGKRGGWGKLAERYPAQSQPAEGLATYQTVKFGAMRIKRGMSIGVTDAGLYLALQSMGPLARRFAPGPMLIPWSELRAVRDESLYLGHPGVRFEVGTPPLATVTIPKDLADLAQLHLT